MASKDKAGKKNPDAELEDLDVREVSIVDRPAIKRKFLIVKRQGGDLGVIRLEDQEMPEAKQVEDQELEIEEIDMEDVIKEDEEEGSILDMLDVEEDVVAEDAVKADEDSSDEAEIVEKAVKADAVKRATALTAKLMSLVNKLKGMSKKEEAGKLPTSVTNEIRSIVQALTAMVASLTKGEPSKPAKKEEDTEVTNRQDPKVVAGAIKIATAALERMMSAVNRLKELDDDVTKIPSAIINELRGIATELNRIVTRYGYPAKAKAKKTEEGQEETLKAFISDDGTGDPEIILVSKAGAKMKHSRLSAFEKAVNTLMTLLNEIKGENKKDKKETKKSDEEDPDMSDKDKGHEGDKATASTTKDWMEGITKQIGELATKFEELSKGLTGQVEALSKKVEEAETIPAGEGDGDPAPTETKKSFWAGRIYP